MFDASKEPVGRMASKIAFHLMGKDRPEYTPSELTGAHVVVINAQAAVFTGNKEEQKSYAFYSGFPGGLSEIDLPTMRERRPADVVTLAVRRMLPKTRLGRQMLARLKVYAGEEHPHTAQKPEAVN